MSKFLLNFLVLIGCYFMSANQDFQELVKNFKKDKVASIIGVGHMGQALAEGFKQWDTNIIISGHPNGYLNKLNKINKSKNNNQKLVIAPDNKEAVKHSDIVILAVKPFAIKEVIAEIKELVKDKILVSVAAGVSIDSLATMLNNPKQKIVRAMPNLPVKYNQGLTGLWFNENLDTAEQNSIISLFLGLGGLITVDNEKELDILTVISGCGPALVSYFIEALSQAGKSLGLNHQDADSIALKTFGSTLGFFQNSKFTPNGVMRATATKGGVSAEILDCLDCERVDEIIKESIKAGTIKINKISETIVNQLDKS